MSEVNEWPTRRYCFQDLQRPRDEKPSFALKRVLLVLPTCRSLDLSKVLPVQLCLHARGERSLWAPLVNEF